MPENSAPLQRKIGPWSATAIVVGSVIGSGIFMKPATMAGLLGSPLLLILVWIVAGLVSIFGAMVYAELGAMFPETGGQYVYLEKMYGGFVAFLFGWCAMAVINTAAIAAIAFVCADYLNYFLHLPHFSATVEHSLKFRVPYVADIYPLQNVGVKSLALGIILILTVVNYVSVRMGNTIQLVATVLKIAAIVLLVFGLTLSGRGDWHHIVEPSAHLHLQGKGLWLAFMAATTGAFVAYDGWANVNMVAGEIKDPQKNLTRSLLVGLFACILIYVLVNIAYLYVFPIDEMAKSSIVASDAAEKVLGVIGGSVIAFLIIVSTFGATHVNLLTNSRVVFAMGANGSFLRWAGKVNPRFQTPANAIVIMGILASLFVISGSFDILADMFVFMEWVFYALTVVGFFILRFRQPGLERPYRAKGYPWLPLIFIVFTLLYIGSTLYNDIDNFRNGRNPVINSVLGLLLTLTGVPFYLYFRRRNPSDSLKPPL